MILRTLHQGRITFDSAMNCDDARAGLETMLMEDDRMTTRNDNEIAFQMIGDNLNDTLRQVGR